MAAIRQEMRYHPNLPTVAQANANKTLFYSDHLPVMSDIPIGNTKLKIITWNVQIPNTPSGCDVQETKEEANAREERSLNALAAFIKEQNPDIILLQETYFDREKLKAKLAELKWEVDVRERTKEEDPSTFTLFNPAKLEKLEHKLEMKDANQVYQPNFIQQTLFKLKSEESAGLIPTTVLVNNVHLPHDEIPNQAESYILALLNAAQIEYGHAIVAGDFNNRYVPLGGKKYLVNNVVSAQFREDILIQGVDWTDGFFFMGKDKACHQPEGMLTLDPANGLICEVPEMKLTDFSEKQKSELIRYRPMLCCAQDYKENKFELTEEERAQLREAGLGIGLAVNAFNHQKEAKHYSKKFKNKQHLTELDKAISLLSSPNETLVHLVCEYLASDSISVPNALKATLTDKTEFKGINTVKEYLLSAKAKLDELKVNVDVADSYYKTLILAKMSNPITQVQAMHLARSLTETHPELALLGCQSIQTDYLNDSNKNMLIRTILLAHVKNLLKEKQTEYENAGGVTNIFKRKTLTNQITLLQSYLDPVASLASLEEYQGWMLSIGDNPRDESYKKEINKILRDRFDKDIMQRGLLSEVTRPRSVATLGGAGPGPAL